MSISLRDKILAIFGIMYYCGKCGLVFVGKKQCDKHERKCKKVV